MIMMDTRQDLTLYGFVKENNLDTSIQENGVNVALLKDLRSGRCDIKSIALLPNVLGYQRAREQGFCECLFERNGTITEASHSNIVFVINGTLFYAS